MIQFSTTVQALMANPTVETFFLVKIGSYVTTNYFTNLTVGADTYVSDGRLISVDPPKMSTSVDREIYRIILADPDFIFGTNLEDNVVGRVADVKVGFVSAGTPLLNLADLLTVYRGKVDGGNYDVNTESVGEVRAVFTCASPMADLDAVRQMYTSRDELRNIDPKDTSFEQVYEGSGKIEVKWGKG